LVNEACFKRRAYHVAFPSGATPEERMLLMGSALLVDVAVFENDDDGDGGGED
jgi:hypothetical protein